MKLGPARAIAYVPYRSLHSTDQALIVVPRNNLEYFGRRAFSCARLWNSLPLLLRTQHKEGPEHFFV